MQKCFSLLVLLSIAVFLFAYTLAQGLPEITIDGTNATTTIELAMPPNDLFDAREVDFRLPADEAVFCNADNEVLIDLQTPSNDLFDVSEVDFCLPNEAMICHSDDDAAIDLQAPPEEFFNPAPDVKILSKIPVLFIPGLLSTEIKRDNELLWADIERIINPFNDDEFMDPLAFGNDLRPLFDTSLLDVIDRKVKIVGNNEIVLYEYSQGLINEFARQGYNAIEGSDDQTFYTFPYDWRYGASGVYPKPGDTSQRDITNSDLLAERIEDLAEISPTGEVDVIAHSLGGLIVKKYVKENSGPRIGKLVFVGVPNLGAPLAGRALIAGTDFGVFGLNPGELKKIAQNMPAAYDLLPSKQYFSAKGPWIHRIKTTGILGINQTEELNYTQTRLYLAGTGTNSAAINQAISLHSDLDDMDADDFSVKGIDTYNIAGCKSAVFSQLSDWVNQNGTHNHYEFFNIANGDDTVPFESANLYLASDDNTFYAPETKHGQMPSFNGVRQKVIGIVSGNDVPVPENKIITRPQLLANDKLCKLYGTTIKIESPLAIKITDNFGNVIEDVENVGPKNEIPGAAFEVIDGKKFVYLPQGNNQEYEIELQGTGQGLFTLITQAIENDIPKEPRVFAAIPVNQSLQGVLEVDEGQTVLEIDTDGDGTIDQTLTRGDESAVSIDSIIADINVYYKNGQIKNKITKNLLLAQLKAIKFQLNALEKLEANNKLPARTKSKLTEAMGRIINKQIDLLVKKIRKMTDREIEKVVAETIIEKLKNLKV